MLTQLTINNFAIAHDLAIDFSAGMTAITGETGAGKSIAIDALSLCLGNRSDSTMVSHTATRADICARFSLDDAPQAATWLKKNHFDHQECLLRRVINTDGRSRGFINGTAVPISQLRELGQYLIQIHGQHDHQLLLKSEHQRKLLDAFADQPKSLKAVQQAYQTWHQCRQQLLDQQQIHAERQSRQQLLQYQLNELADFMPQPDEYEKLDEEYQLLANSGHFLSISQNALQRLATDEEFNLLASITTIQQLLAELCSVDQKLNNISLLINDAAIQLHEASDELRRYADKIEINPTRQYEIEQRISQQLALARKHQVRPEHLFELYQQLLKEQQYLSQQQDDLTALMAEVEYHYHHLVEASRQLHSVRKKSAQELAALINEHMQHLAMTGSCFLIEVTYQADHITSFGADKVEFLVSTSAGQQPQPLYKIVSGGELSRIALAIQVITAKKMDTPALIFDEVDSGISGKTAALVGKLLRQLSQSTQVITVTHLPQVAGNAHHHFFVSKQQQQQQTQTAIQILTQQGKLQELARLLSGDKITDNTLANAKELLIIK